MRIEATSSELTIETSVGIVGKVFAVFFVLLAPLLLVAMILGAVLPAHTKTVTCDSVVGSCVVSASQQAIASYSISEISKFEIAGSSGTRNASPSAALQLALKDGKTVRLTQGIFGRSIAESLQVSAGELNRVLDGSATWSQQSVVDRDTDYASLSVLFVGSVGAAWAFLRLWRSCRVAVDKTTRTLRVQARGALIRFTDTTIAFDELTHISAESHGRRGWAEVSLLLRDGSRVRLLFVPRLGRVRTQLRELLPTLSACLGVKVVRNDGYRDAWD